MAIGKRGKGRQQELFVAASEIRALGNPFYRALNRLLEEEGFDEFAEETCREFYAEKRGRPGIPPGVYFRMLLVGYLEGIGSERGIAWRCGDSISLREFLGYGLERNPPEHSGLSKTRKRLSVEAHAAVFSRVLEVVQASGLLSGKTLGVDSTTLEANAAMRSIVRRDDGKGYEEWLEEVARASGIETPTRQDLAKLDRKRPKKGSNREWAHPHDPEARITKMKDGRTGLAHKFEQAVDMEIAARMPVLGLGADIITGFPGETEVDHKQTVALVEELPYTYLHVFPFSPRQRTEAALTNTVLPIPQRVSGERSRELRELVNTKAASYRRERADGKAKVVFESGRTTALTGDYLRVSVPKSTSREVPNGAERSSEPWKPTTTLQEGSLRWSGKDLAIDLTRPARFNWTS